MKKKLLIKIKNYRMLFLSSAVLTAAVSVMILSFQKNLSAEEISVTTYENLNIPNWSGNDYAPGISPDGQFLIFQSDRPGYRDGNNLWFSVNRNYRNVAGRAEWTPVIPLRFPYLNPASESMKILKPAGTLENPPGAFTINTDGFEGMSSIRYENYEPVEIFFTSRRDAESGRDGYAGLNIYYSHYIQERWTKPEHLNIINSQFDDRMPVISQDGRYLYFSSGRPGGFGGNDIWYSMRDTATGKWDPPVNAGESVNTEYNEISPCISEDGMLFFSSDRPSGFGHYDLYYSISGDNAKNLGLPFNSTHDDEYFSITQDGFWAYFSSDRDHPDALGGMDLYRAVVPPHLRGRVSVVFTGVVLDGSTKKALGLDATIKINYEKETIVETSSLFQRDPGKALVNNFSINLLSGREYTVEVSAPGYHPRELILDYRGNIPSGKTDRHVIYLMPVKKEGDTLRDLRLVPGRVIDRNTGLSLPGSKVQYSTGDGGMTAVTVDRDGRFAVNVRRNMEFRVQASAPGYEDAYQVFVEKEDLKEVVIELGKASGAACPGDAPECIDNLRVYFDLNSSDLKKDQEKTLDAIVQIMKKNLNLKVEIQGHTDRTYRGPKKEAFAYNQRLSEMRARNIYLYLTKKGIPAARLSIRGYSFSQPRTLKNKALNRRVEFRRILK